MYYVRWTFLIIAFLIVAGFLHYTLPQRDIVRVVNTYEERQDLGGWTDIFWSGGGSSGQATSSTRDVLFIQTVQADGEPMVYRNEDTGWGWPPYFKFDTADLQTRAADAISTRDAPEWFAVRHYGWRNQWVSAFPNALSIRPVAGPETTLIPWFNIVFIAAFLALIGTLYRLWRNFRTHRVDPALENLDNRASRWWSR